VLFAYGSLVNPLARPAGLQAFVAELPGWRREWMHRVETPYGKICSLTAMPNKRASIRGVLLVGGRAEPFDLDEREIGYERVTVSIRVFDSSFKSPTECFLYTGSQPFRGPATPEYPIWRSYLDCVVAGYLRLGGIEGIEEFITSTSGWEAPILDDRPSPKYPRAVNLIDSDKDVIDNALRNHGILRYIFS
jgi:hypothetical protein